MFACKYTYAPTCCKHEHCHVDGVQVSVPVEARDSLGVFYSSSLSLNLKLLHSVKTTDEHPQDLPISAPPPPSSRLIRKHRHARPFICVLETEQRSLFLCGKHFTLSPAPVWDIFRDKDNLN